MEDNFNECGLNPNQTLDNFCVTDACSFAYKSAMKVAEGFACGEVFYNPLVITGSTGSGKTHLLNAIGNRVTAAGNVKIKYCTAVQISNDVISAMRNSNTDCNSMNCFRGAFQDISLLLIDDFDFLAGKNTALSEVKAIMNNFLQQNKQMVISIKEDISALDGVDESIVSILKGGLNVTIEDQAGEEKFQFLKKKEETMGVNVPDYMLRYIADEKNNNSELQGALSKLIELKNVFN